MRTLLQFMNGRMKLGRCGGPFLALLASGAFVACGSAGSELFAAADSGASGETAAPAAGGVSGMSGDTGGAEDLAGDPGQGAAGESGGRADPGAAGEPAIAGEGGASDSAGQGGAAIPAGGAGVGGHGASAGRGGSLGAGTGGGGSGGLPAAVCGNNTRESGEQCDDGNLTKLDGCNEICRMEQNQRSNWFKVKFTPDTFCTANAFGSALGLAARTLLQDSLDARVVSGNFSLLLAFANFGDLTGTTENSLSLGVLAGIPVAHAGYDGMSDLDWWYKPRPAGIDSQRNPVSKLAGSVTAGVLTAGPGSMGLPLFSDLSLSVSRARLRLPLGATSKPLVSNGAPPGHLSREHLSPSLVSFATGGAPTTSGAGELCGNISAASLASQPIPLAYTSAGTTPCAEVYTSGNTLLDLLVHGCTIAATQVVVQTEPDQVDSAAPQPGQGAPYRLITSSGHLVTRCNDASDVAVALDACLKAAAYSSAYRFTTDRVIIE